VDATSVYWINTSNTGGGFSTLMKVPIGGGTPTTLASGSFSPSATGQIAVDSTSVYWVNGSDYRSANGSVMAVAQEGGTPTTLAARQTTLAAWRLTPPVSTGPPAATPMAMARC